jgi:hypothetical protein
LFFTLKNPEGSKHRVGLLKARERERRNNKAKDMPREA